MKEYEHRRLVCEHECKVGEKYVLPQAQAFGLSWSNTNDRLADIHKNSWGSTEMKRRPPPEQQRVGELPPFPSRIQLLLPW